MKASNASSAATLVSAIQISCSARLAFGCWLFGNLASTFAVLCTQQRCSRVFGQTSPAAFQNPSAPSAITSCGGTLSPRRLRSSSRSRQSCAFSRAPSVKPTRFLAAFRRRADQHEDALFFVFEPRFEMDAISPDVDVALGRQIALLPRGVLVEPAVLQSADGGCRQSGSILAKQRRQRLGEVASRNPLQVKDRQQRLDRLRAAHVGRQDRRREPDAARIGSRRLAIAYTRLADGDRTDTGHHLALRQVAVADDALVAVLGLQIGMLAEKVCDLGFDRLGEKGTCPVAQDFCELIVEDSWLNQLDDVIVGHGISLLRWRSGGVKHPHDMPPSRFPPSPTLGDSSLPLPVCP